MQIIINDFKTIILISSYTSLTWPFKLTVYLICKYLVSNGSKIEVNTFFTVTHLFIILWFINCFAAPARVQEYISCHSNEKISQACENY